MRPLKPGAPDNIGGITLRGRLGEGGMGTVYFGATPDGGQVAVKTIRQDLTANDEAKDRFDREILALGMVGGPRVAVLLAASGPDEDVSWPVGLLALEVVPLAHRLADLGVPVPTDEEIGRELNDQGWQAEMAWLAPRAAVIADGDEECVAAFRAEGWDARVAGDWPPEELAARLMGGSR